MKRTVSIVIGMAIIVVGFLVFNLLNTKKDKTLAETVVENEPEIIAIKSKTVELIDIPYTIEATGTLQAKEKIEIYSEVQGILQYTKTPFKIGNRFSRGTTLIAIDSKEHAAQIKSNRSDLINQIAAMLPDMEIDYPDVYKKWEVYLENINVNALVPQLPEFSSNEEKLFVSGKSIYSTYFNIKNLEERLSKYYIRAPFSGTVTESNVNVGTLIRSGQKIGEFIDNSKFELQLSIPASENKFLIKGTQVNLQTIDNTQSFVGSITRVNGKIDQDTQSVDVIVEVANKSLKDGQYLKAQIEGEKLNNVFRIDNALILENNMVYVVEDNLLQLKALKVLNYQGNTAVVTGLENGTLIANQSIANAYPGMLVEIVN